MCQFLALALTAELPEAPVSGITAPPPAPISSHLRYCRPTSINTSRMPALFSTHSFHIPSSKWKEEISFFLFFSAEFYLFSTMMDRELHNNVLQALEVAAQRRHRATLARKETRKQALSAHGYHCLQRQLNKKTFLAPIDADTTKANIYYIKKKFIR